MFTYGPKYYVLEPAGLVPQGSSLPASKLLPWLEQHDYLIVSHVNLQDVGIKCSLKDGVEILGKTGGVNEDYSGLKQLTESLEQTIGLYALKDLNRQLANNPSLKQYIELKPEGTTLFPNKYIAIVNHTRFEISNLTDVKAIFSEAQKMQTLKPQKTSSGI